jgi:flagellar secretion chaperone FliS
MTQLPGAQTRYLDARISTASQPELQLMLLDGALRFARQAQQLWDGEDQLAECHRLLGRVLDVIEELVRGATLGATDVSKRLEEEYAFAFRQVAMAQLNHDAAPLEAAVQVLGIHRETWRLACEKLRAEAPAAGTPVAALDASLAGETGLSLQV